MRGQPITVYGEGQQTRSFCYVSDLIEGICRLLEFDEHLPTNVGNPQEITILEFAERIVKMTGAKVPIVFKPLPQDDPKQRLPGYHEGEANSELGTEGGIGRRLKATLRISENRLKPEVEIDVTTDEKSGPRCARPDSRFNILCNVRRDLKNHPPIYCA